MTMPKLDYVHYDDYLMHYGVKGMKWGKRKKKDKSDSRPLTSDDAADAKNLQRAIDNKGVGHLSNKELKSVVARMELQQQYDKLQTKGSRVESGKNFLADVFADAAKNVATSFVEDAMRGAASAGADRARKSYTARRTDKDQGQLTSRRRMIGS